jgi:hypothetical protein
MALQPEHAAGIEDGHHPPADGGQAADVESPRRHRHDAALVLDAVDVAQREREGVSPDLDDEVAGMALRHGGFACRSRGPIGLRRHDRIEQGCDREQPVAFDARHRTADPAHFERYGRAAMGDDHERRSRGAAARLAQQSIEPHHRYGPSLVKCRTGQDRVGVRHRSDGEIVGEPDDVVQREMVRPGSHLHGERLLRPLPSHRAGLRPLRRRDGVVDWRARSGCAAWKRHSGQDFAEIEQAFGHARGTIVGRHYSKHLIDRERESALDVAHHHHLAGAGPVRALDIEETAEVDHGYDDAAQAGDAKQWRPRPGKRRQPRHRGDTGNRARRQGETRAGNPEHHIDAVAAVTHWRSSAVGSPRQAPTWLRIRRSVPGSRSGRAAGSRPDAPPPPSADAPGRAPVR